MSMQAAVLLGLAMGAKHTLEADHLAAVCNLAAHDDASVRAGGLWRAARSAAAWAAGHALTLALASAAVVAAGVTVPHTLALSLDLAVAAVLIVLGLGALRPRPARGASDEPCRGALAGRTHRRSFVVGLVHGASGTAALTLLVATTLPDRTQALGYIATFSAASMLVMPAAALAVFWLVRGALGLSPHRAALFRRVAAIASIAAGIAVALGALSLSTLA